MKARFEKLDFETRKAVEAVFRSVKFGKADLSFASRDGDEDEESRPVGKFTDLKPAQKRGARDSSQEKNRRRDGKSRGRNEEEGKPNKKKAGPREKIAGNEEAYPAFGQ